MDREQAVKIVDLYTNSLKSKKEEVCKLLYEIADDADKLHRAAYYLATAFERI